MAAGTVACTRARTPPREHAARAYKIEENFPPVCDRQVGNIASIYKSAPPPTGADTSDPIHDGDGPGGPYTADPDLMLDH